MTEQLIEAPAAQAPRQVAAAPAQVNWASVPRVNLLPVAIVQGRRFRRTQRMLGVVVLTGVLAASTGVALAQRDVSAAQDDLTQAQSQVSNLQRRAAKYAAVPAIVAQVEAAQKARASVMSSDVLWYRFLTDLDGARPDGVTQDTVSVSLTARPAGGAAPAGSGSPLAPAGLGTLNLTGDATQYREISAWLDALDEVSGVASPSLSSATTSKDASRTTVKYSVSAVVSDTALSHRYDKEGS